VFDIIDVLDGRSEDKAREHDTDTIGRFILLDVLPDGQFSKLFTCAVTDVGILCLAGIFNCNLFVRWMSHGWAVTLL
jgi:hypothetical protein